MSRYRYRTPGAFPRGETPLVVLAAMGYVDNPANRVIVETGPEGTVFIFPDTKNPSAAELGRLDAWASDHGMGRRF